MELVEGAKVLPEVDQTLGEIGLALKRVEDTSLSVRPAPDGVDGIGSALDVAASEVSDKLGGI